VEDEARVRKLILDVLTANGYTVVEATRGEEAIRLWKSRHGAIDLAVINVVMPGMSGPDLVRRLVAPMSRHVAAEAVSAGRVLTESARGA
jgi:two-component system cell cycle sensor histidine kinase/response regulator CckA